MLLAFRGCLLRGVGAGCWTEAEIATRAASERPTRPGCPGVHASTKVVIQCVTVLRQNLAARLCAQAVEKSQGPSDMVSTKGTHPDGPERANGSKGGGFGAASGEGVQSSVHASVSFSGGSRFGSFGSIGHSGDRQVDFSGTRGTFDALGGKPGGDTVARPNRAVRRSWLRFYRIAPTNKLCQAMYDAALAQGGVARRDLLVASEWTERARFVDC